MDEIISNFLQIQAQLKILHWQTNKYGEHKTFEFAYEELGDLIDKFVESYQGIQGRIVYSSSDSRVLNIFNYGKLNSTEWLNNVSVFIKTNVKDQVADVSSDLTNIADEMLTVIHKSLYLLTLK